jgi:hypothetical protein
MIFGATPELPTINPLWARVEVWNMDRTVEEYAKSGLPIVDREGNAQFDPKRTVAYMIANDPKQFFNLAEKVGFKIQTSRISDIIDSLSKMAKEDPSVSEKIIKIWTLFIPDIDENRIDDYYSKLIRSMDFHVHRAMEMLS